MNKHLLLLIVLIGLIVSAQKPENDFQNKKIVKLDSLYSSLYENGKFNGNVLIAENGVPIFEKSFGLANENTRFQLTKNSVFNLASLTKQFTAAAIVILHKKGKLSYDDDFTKYLPELHFYKGITIKDLLIHQSGLPSYMAVMDQEWDKTKTATNQDVIKLFEKVKPSVLFQPKERLQYSNTGYVFLASIIERLSHDRYSNFLQQNIFNPLQMDATKVLFRHKDTIAFPALTKAYISNHLNTKIEPQNLKTFDYVIYVDGVYGQGRLHATTPDLLKWDQALYTNKIIDETDRKMIFSSYKTKVGQHTGYGFGWYISNRKPYGKIAFHSGGWPGYVTYLERHLDTNKTIIILQNNSGSKIETPVENTRRILYGLEVKEKKI
tara:strand:+ start:43566 stop:44705 length:1140 start_codon:yes stop_codon:yes gene_type:complete